jgi:hypothetical protein
MASQGAPIQPSKIIQHIIWPTIEMAVRPEDSSNKVTLGQWE